MFERLANELAKELFDIADQICTERNAFHRDQYISDAYEIEKKANTMFEKAGLPTRVSISIEINGPCSSVSVTSTHHIPNLTI